MLAHRIIPVILINGSANVIKTINFKTRRTVGSLVTVIRTYESRNIDELIVLDIDASKEKRKPCFDIIRGIANDCFMPVTFGGGLNTKDDIKAALRCGADKVVINTAALLDVECVRDFSRTFRSQCIVASIDWERENGRRTVYCHAGQPITRRDPAEWARLCASMGAGEIFLNCVTDDGTLHGIDRSILSDLAGLPCPVILSGGLGAPSECPGIIQSGADAVAASSIFLFTNHTPEDCKEELRKNGIPSR